MLTRRLQKLGAISAPASNPRKVSLKVYLASIYRPILLILLSLFISKYAAHAHIKNTDHNDSCLLPVIC